MSTFFIMGCSKGSTSVKAPTGDAQTEEAGAEDTPAEDASAEDQSLVRSLLIEALESSLVPEELLTPSGELTNAIIRATKIVMLEDNGDSCKIKVTYPDVKTAFLEGIAALPEEITENTQNEFYYSLKSKLENGELDTLEETLELNVLEDENGEKYLDWTQDAMRVTTGGLSEIYYEEMNSSKE